MILAWGYNSDLGVDHWTTVKIILSYLKGLRNILSYGSDKEFIVKGSVDVSFFTDTDDSESQTGYILKVGAII